METDHEGAAHGGPVSLPRLDYALTAEQQFDLTRLTPEAMARVNQIVATVSFADTNSLLSFGSEAQRQLSQHLDELLDGIRTSEVGAAGDLTIELATTIKALNLQKMKREIDGQDWVAASVGWLPVVGPWFSALRYLQLSHRKVKDHLDAIEQRAQADLAKLNAMNDRLDRLVESSIEHIQDLELYLAAAQIIVKRARVEFEQRREVAAKSKDVVEISRLRDFCEQLNAFEARVVRMHVAHGESMVAVPEIRTGQTASRIEMSNIMDSLLFDLPHLKRAIVQVAALDRTARAARANAARRELSRQIATIGSEQLQSVYLQAKQSQGGAEQDVALLAQSADRLLQTIELGQQLDLENARKRDRAIGELAGIKRKFTDALLASGAQFVSRTTSV
ncbi:MAG: toxic anion resistance protein [Leptothrix sp. (in: b-proteobacteria)]